MELLDAIKTRRSIRKYKKQRVEKEKLDKILEAGIYAPNPGGRQGTKIIMLDNQELIEKIGIVNASVENRNWGGMTVSGEQPSIIDDLSIKSGFYGCPALGIVCVPKARKDAVNVIGSAFVCAQNMVMEAYSLGHDIFSDEENIVVFPNGNILTDKVYYSELNDEYITFTNDAIDSGYISDIKEFANDILEVSNGIIKYDLIKRIGKDVGNCEEKR